MPSASAERPHVFTARDARAEGHYPRLLAAQAEGRVDKARRGAYFGAGDATNGTRERRHLAQVLAVEATRRHPVFAGVSAAVILGLPIVDTMLHRVVTLSPGESGRNRNGVIEIGRRGFEQVIEHDGLFITDVVTTIIDAARLLPLTSAVALIDAAVRLPRWGSEPALIGLERLRSAVEELGTFRGRRHVEAALLRARPECESPLESVSRVNIERLGFPEPVLQHGVELAPGWAFLDVAWPDYEAWGEADGRGKYLGAFRLPGDERTEAEIIHDEKRREDAIRRVTKWTCGRWGWDEGRDPVALRRILLETGLPIVRRPGLAF